MPAAQVWYWWGCRTKHRNVSQCHRHHVAQIIWVSQEPTPISVLVWQVRIRALLRILQKALLRSGSSSRYQQAACKHPAICFPRVLGKERKSHWDAWCSQGPLMRECCSERAFGTYQTTTSHLLAFPHLHLQRFPSLHLSKRQKALEVMAALSRLSLCSAALAGSDVDPHTPNTNVWVYSGEARPAKETGRCGQQLSPNLGSSPGLQRQTVWWKACLTVGFIFLCLLRPLSGNPSSAGCCASITHLQSSWC